MGVSRKSLHLGDAEVPYHPLPTPTLMKPQQPLNRLQCASGKIGWALLWLLGIPLPVLLIIYLIKGH